jgi:hypothetical protein
MVRITGPGDYPVSATVTLNFCIRDPAGTIADYYWETDMGTASGQRIATPCNCGEPFVFLPGGLNLTISTPEPSTLPSVLGSSLPSAFHGEGNPAALRLTETAGLGNVVPN